jgi:SAM-dependent methyltransferase
MPDLADRPLLAPTGEAAPGSPGRPGSAGWPDGIRAELARRRARLTAGPVSPAGGRRLDLAEPDALASVLDAGREVTAASAPDPAAGADRFDVVLSVAALVAVADLPLALRGIRRLLEPTGRFLFVEPVVRPGWAGVLAASAGAVLAPVRGQHLGRDVPLALRHAGFVITDLERFTMPSPLWPLRSFVDGCARLRVGGLGR